MVIIELLRYLIRFMQILITIRILASWLPNIDPYSQPMRFLYDVTEPIMKPVRDFMRRYVNTGPIDLSPLLVFFLLRAADIYLLRLLL